MIRKVKQLFQDRSNPVWVFLNQFYARGAVALKFLIIARILGPDSVGLISVALICLALMESLTEMGITQAIVQRKEDPSEKQLDTLWTFLFIRGALITVIMIAGAPLLADLFNAPNSLFLIYLVAFVPLFRNSASIKLHVQTRNRNFKLTSTIQAITISADFILCITLMLYNHSPISSIMSLLIAEILRTIVSHVALKTRPKLSFDFKSIKDVTSYGKWIWGHSISAFIFNQLDKIIAARYLGTVMLGQYQMGQKLNQMALTDVSFAFSQYLFPNYSKMIRESNHQLYRFYRVNMSLMIGFCALTSVFIMSNSEFIIRLILGESWLALTDIMALLAISASLAAIVNISDMFVRALGNPKLVTILTYFQVLVYIVVLFIVGHLTVQTLILASIISLLVTNGFLFGYIIYRANRSIMMDLVKNCLVTSMLSAVLFCISMFIHSPLLHFICSLVVYLGLLFMEYKFATRSNKGSSSNLNSSEVVME